MKTIDGVPESITRKQYCDLIAAVGFDVNQLRELEFRVDGVYAVIYDVNENGLRRIDSQQDGIVTNRVFIPVKD